MGISNTTRDAPWNKDCIPFTKNLSITITDMIEYNEANDNLAELIEERMMEIRQIIRNSLGKNDIIITHIE